MPLPSNKKELLDNLNQAYEKLISEYDDIPEELIRERTMDEGTSVADILSYQIGWGKVLLSWEKNEQANRKVHMPKKGFKWNQLGELAESFYEDYESKNYKQLKSLFKKTVRDIENQINELSHDEIFKPHHREWTGEKWAMVKWIQINTVAPYKSARTKVRRWKKLHLSVRNLK